MRKRIWASFLCAVMLLMLCSACGDSETAAESSAADATDTQTVESAAEESSEAVSEGVVVEETASNAYFSEETQEIIETFASAAGAVPAEEVPDEEKTDLWRFVESEEYQAAMKEARAEVDALMPGPVTSYDSDGNPLSVKGVPYSYPLEERRTISVFASIRGLVSNYIGSNEELSTFQIASAETNIDVEWQCVSGDIASTQMSLIFASGDYPDLVSDFSYSYTGTAADAYDNDLIVPLNDYLAEYSPNYQAWLESDERFMRDATADDGNLYAWYCLQPVVVNESGGWVRADLLESYGLDAPTTIDEFETFFELCKEDGLTSVISAGCYSFAGIATSAYDLPSMAGPTGFLEGMYHIGDTVYCAYLQDSCYEWLSKMCDWYEKGYFSQDLVALNGSESANSEVNELIYTGEVAYMQAGAGHYSNYVQNASVEGWDVIPVQNMVIQDGDTTHFFEDYAINATHGSIVLTSQCEDIEAACRYVDWFYTDIGINASNYGAEGLTWNWSSDGTTRLFNAALYDNAEYALPAAAVSNMYTGTIAWPTITDCMPNLYYANSQIAIDAESVWSVNNDSEYYLNTDVLSFTVEESDVIKEYWSDIDTYLAENLVKFLIGDKDIEAEWDEFVSTLEDMGIENVIEVYQNAYDRYIAR